MIFAKFKMMELPNGKFLLISRHWGIWQYAHWVEFHYSETSASMFQYSFLGVREYDEYGSDTMKEAIVKWCKTATLIRERKEAEKTAVKPKVVYKWLSESSMLMDMDNLDEL